MKTSVPLHPSALLTGIHCTFIIQAVVLCWLNPNQPVQHPSLFLIQYAHGEKCIRAKQQHSSLEIEKKRREKEQRKEKEKQKQKEKQRITQGAAGSLELMGHHLMAEAGGFPLCVFGCYHVLHENDLTERLDI